MDLALPKKLNVLFEPHRYKVLYGGRGGSKSWGVARALLALGASRKLRILCTREVQKSIRDSVHKLLEDQIQVMGLGHHYQVLQNELRGANGTEFLFAGLSTQTVESIKSYEGVDICWVEEAQAVTKKSWEILVPTIRRAASEIWVTFNPDLDTDETYVRFVENTPPDTALVSINWYDNPWFPDVLRSEKDHLKLTDPAAYENVWGGKCKPAAEGAIYAKEVAALAGRIVNVPADPMLKVHAIWDLGFNDQTSIICVQRKLSEIRIVDYIEDNRRTMAEYVSMLKNRPYNWGTDYLPWDGAESSYDLTDRTTSPEGILKRFGRKVSITPKLDVENGIKKARLIFPMCYFDRERTVRLRECLKRYRRTIPISTNEPGSPLHDQYSHGADAFRYLSLVVDKMTNDDMNAKKISYSSQGIV